MDILDNIDNIRKSLPESVTLVAVSKTKPASMILDLHNAGQIDFGENKVQDLVAKAKELPKTIKWHMIGHLQSNKVKLIAPFIHLIHGVDSFKLLEVIDREAEKAGRTISCLIQVRIAKEETKFGMSEQELLNLLEGKEFAALKNVKIVGLMGMATFTDDLDQVRLEFKNLKRIFEHIKNGVFVNNDFFKELSMGMSDDYLVAVEVGSTMVRIGSLIFGPRNYV